MTDIAGQASSKPGLAVTNFQRLVAEQEAVPADINRRLLLGIGLALGAAAIRPAHAGSDAIQTGYANGPAAVADAFFFPGFRQCLSCNIHHAPVLA